MFAFDSRVRYSEVDSEGKLTWLALMDYFQDCCVFHSEKVKCGVEYLKENHMAWVLSSWQICLNRMPVLTEQITVQTWPYEMKGFYGYRNFALTDAGGNRLAYANSVWVLIDTLTERPMRVPQGVGETYGLEPALPMECCGRKISIPAEYEEREPLVVPKYFIDTNQHMNNSRYVQVAMEYLPENFQVKEVRVEYKKAAKQSDLLIPRVSIENEQVIVALCGEDGNPYAVIEFM